MPNRPHREPSRAWIVTMVLAIGSVAGLLIAYASFAASLDFSTLEGFFSMFALTGVYSPIILALLVSTIFFTVVTFALKARG